MAALVVGGALLPLLYFLQTVQKVSPISAIVQLMPLMVAAIGVDWEGRRQVLRVELANRALSPDRVQLATYPQSPFRPAPCCHVTGPQRTGPGQQPTVLEQLRRICKSHYSKCVNLEV
jgi:hypothetical protein